MAEERQRGPGRERGLSAAVAAARGIRPDPGRPEPYETGPHPDRAGTGPWAWLRLPWRGTRG